MLSTENSMSETDISLSLSVGKFWTVLVGCKFVGMEAVDKEGDGKSLFPVADSGGVPVTTLWSIRPASSIEVLDDQPVAAWAGMAGFSCGCVQVDSSALRRSSKIPRRQKAAGSCSGTGS